MTRDMTHDKPLYAQVRFSRNTRRTRTRFTKQKGKVMSFSKLATEDQLEKAKEAR
jgi:hypothetical protein